VNKSLNGFMRSLCGVVIATLLSAQAAFATQPCVTPGMSAARAVVSQGDGDRHKYAVSSVNTCVTKCADGDKLSAYSSLVVPPPPTHTVLVLPALPDNTLAVAAIRSLVEPVADP